MSYNIITLFHQFLSGAISADILSITENRCEIFKKYAIVSK